MGGAILSNRPGVVVVLPWGDPKPETLQSNRSEGGPLAWWWCGWWWCKQAA